MLIITKATLAIMIGFILALICGIIFIPLLKKLNVRQHVSKTLGKRHLVKEGTPTIGGIIFIIPTIITLIFLYLRGSIGISSNLSIVLIVFLAYALLGFIDDFLKIKYHNNKGFSIWLKLIIQTIIASIFFFIFMKHGGSSTLEISFLNLSIPLGPFFGLFILIVLVGTTNAVNLTDGLDGLAGGLSAIALFAFGLIAWNTKWMEGNMEVAIFCFVLIGSVLGFLMFNTHPARVIMGDTGSLALGAAIATVAIITRHEVSLILIGGVFVVEALSSIIQIIAIRKFHRKVFKMAPIHHHFEQLGWAEVDIVKVFWIVGFLLAMLAITYGVWL